MGRQSSKLINSNNDTPLQSNNLCFNTMHVFSRVIKRVLFTNTTFNLRGLDQNDTYGCNCYPRSECHR
jgi:hypothetical protein